MNRRLLIAISLCLFVAPFSAHAENWPRFRGPNGSGVSDAKDIPVQWTDEDCNWIAEMPGDGNASPVVWGDRVFITAADAEQQTRWLLCLSAKDGSVLWKRDFPLSPYKKHKNNTFASSTPAVDAERVYVIWHDREQSPLVALDHDGETVWTYPLGPYLHGQGGASSPIVSGDVVAVANDHSRGSFLAALDRRTGELRWKIPREGKRACYATPCERVAADGTTEIVFSHCYEGVIGVERETGLPRWHIDVFGTHSQRALASPLLAAGNIVATSGAVGGRRTLVAVQPPGEDGEVQEAYRIERGAPHVPTPLAVGQRLYLWSDQGIVTCADIESGKKIWQKRVGGNYFGSPICIDDKIYGVSVDGEVVVIAASDIFQELGRTQLSEGSKATPAVGAGKLLVRTSTKLYCVGK